jgi:GT2 family glycosyltransferase
VSAVAAVGAGDAAIIVPSIHVDPLLVRCIATSRDLYPEVDIIALVDDATGREQIEHLATVIETGPVTIGAKRNLGAEKTSARHLAFIDSDAYPEPGWLEAAVALLDGNPAWSAAGGPNVSPPEEPPDERWVGLAHDSALVCGYWRYRRQRHARARDVTALPSCNLVVRREVYQALDGMSEELFTAEDTDFCQRLAASGGTIRFDPRVLVVHKNRNLLSFVVQRYTYGVAMVPLLGKGSAHPVYWAVSVLPAAFAIFVATGPLALVVRPWRRLWAPVMALYAAVVATEAVRLSRRPREVPGTALALVVGNLLPGVGIVLRALGFSRDLRGVYRNDR